MYESNFIISGNLFLFSLTSKYSFNPNIAITYTAILNTTPPIINIGINIDNATTALIILVFNLFTTPYVNIIIYIYYLYKVNFFSYVKECQEKKRLSLKKLFLLSNIG